MGALIVLFCGGGTDKFIDNYMTNRKRLVYVRINELKVF